MNVPSSTIMISPIWVLLSVSVKWTSGINQSLKRQGGHGDYSVVLALALIVIIEIIGAADSRWLSFSFQKQ